MSGRFKMNAHILLYGHLLNWPWRSHLQRRRCRGKAISEAVCTYLHKYIPAFATVEPAPTPRPEPERIFSVWLQGAENAPKIVQACWKNMRRHCPQELVILDEKTLPEWVRLPDYVWEKWHAGKLRPAHFTDIVRLELLYEHGGLWLDSTDYVASPIPEWILKEDFFIYGSGNTLRGSYSFVQNCFFRARKGSYLLKCWREAVLAYWKEEDRIADYFMHQLLFKMVVEYNPKAAGLYARMPHVDQDPTHAIWYGCPDDPFDARKFMEITSAAAFQKTDYKSRRAAKPVPGSNADHIVNG